MLLITDQRDIIGDFVFFFNRDKREYCIKTERFVSNDMVRDIRNLHDLTACKIKEVTRTHLSEKQIYELIGEDIDLVYVPHVASKYRLLPVAVEEHFAWLMFDEFTVKEATQ